MHSSLVDRQTERAADLVLACAVYMVVGKAPQVLSDTLNLVEVGNPHVVAVDNPHLTAAGNPHVAALDNLNLMAAGNLRLTAVDTLHLMVVKIVPVVRARRGGSPTWEGPKQENFVVADFCIYLINHSSLAGDYLQLVGPNYHS